MKAIVKPAVILFVICVLVAAILSGAQLLTHDAIAQAEAQALKDSVFTVLPGSMDIEPIEQEGINGYKGLDAEGKITGYAFIASAKGYGGSVTVTVGIGNDGCITGISVSAPDETPGLGANVQKPDFARQFEGKNGTLQFSIDEAGEGHIDRVTSASYSSRGVTNAVNLALEQYRAVQEQGGDAQ